MFSIFTIIGHIFVDPHCSENSPKNYFLNYFFTDITGQYNSRCISMLHQNFRSHGTLLQVPSRLFYNWELIPKGVKMTTESLLHWHHLPQDGFPIIFHGVRGSDGRDYNADEAVIVVDYVEKLLTDRKKGFQKVL